MTFGRYRPGTTLAYRIDPRTKLLFVTVLVVATFVVGGHIGLAACAAAAIGACAASGIGPKEALSTLRPFIWLMAFVLVFNSLFARSGIVYGLESVARFAIVLVGTSALMVTTTPTELADAITLLLRPLARLGVRTESAGLAVGMTLRFVPVVMDEFGRVRRAQEGRFADFSTGGLVRRVKAWVPVMVPVFANAFRRSRRLALALESRGFGLPIEGGGTPTCIRSYRFRAWDGVVIGLCAGLLALGLVL